MTSVATRTAIPTFAVRYDRANWNDDADVGDAGAIQDVDAHSRAVVNPRAVIDTNANVAADRHGDGYPNCNPRQRANARRDEYAHSNPGDYDDKVEAESLASRDWVLFGCAYRVNQKTESSTLGLGTSAKNRCSQFLFGGSDLACRGN
jgi:hypothetical protein